MAHTKWIVDQDSSPLRLADGEEANLSARVAHPNVHGSASGAVESCVPYAVEIDARKGTLSIWIGRERNK